MKKLTQNELNLLHDVLMGFCEDGDTSPSIGRRVDLIWLKINAMQDNKQSKD